MEFCSFCLGLIVHNLTIIMIILRLNDFMFSWHESSLSLVMASHDAILYPAVGRCSRSRGNNYFIISAWKTVLEVNVAISHPVHVGFPYTDVVVVSYDVTGVTANLPCNGCYYYRITSPHHSTHGNYKNSQLLYNRVAEATVLLMRASARGSSTSLNTVPCQKQWQFP